MAKKAEVLGFKCCSCLSTHTYIRVDRRGCMDTVLEISCHDCSAVTRPGLIYPTDNLIIEEKED